MKRPLARPIGDSGQPAVELRVPRAYAATEARTEEIAFEELESARSLEALAAPPVPPRRWAGRIAWAALGVLVSLGLGLAAERLLRDLYSRYEWLGWAGLVAAAALVAALAVLLVREILALRRLAHIGRLRENAALALTTNRSDDGKAVLARLHSLYSARPDLARARTSLDANADHIFEGAEMVRFAERTLMAPIDGRARALTAASARRVALVTAVSPRALIDIAFVLYESVRLVGAIAALYGVRPGVIGFWRLGGAILGHLAVTGGLVLTDGIVEQLVGQGLAARLSARLGEGVVNGLMTVRVGIAAMRVVRPLPFEALTQPVVKDFIPELANVLKGGPNPG